MINPIRQNSSAPICVICGQTSASCGKNPFGNPKQLGRFAKTSGFCSTRTSPPTPSARFFLQLATLPPTIRVAANPPTPPRPAMLAKLHTFSLLGIEALPVEVEVDVSPGAIPKTILVGLPEQAVKESTHRIERAMVNSGFVRPQDRVVINLAPA
jgi:hypothetical protein